MVCFTWILHAALWADTFGFSTIINNHLLLLLLLLLLLTAACSDTDPN
jgi:hypothetical protein